MERKDAIIYEIRYSADVFGEQELFKEYVSGGRRLADEHAFKKSRQAGTFYRIKALAVTPLG